MKSQRLLNILNSKGRIIYQIMVTFHYYELKRSYPLQLFILTWASVDLIVCFPRLCSNFLVHTHTDLVGRDHFPSDCLPDTGHPIQTQPVARYNYKKMDWTKYT